MSSSTRVQVLSSKSEEIFVLAEFLRNPELASELANEVKLLNALTEEEEAKSQEARSLVSRIDEMKSELEQLEAVVIETQSKLDEEVKSKRQETDDWVLSEQQNIFNQKNALDARKIEQEAEDVRLIQKENRLKETAAAMQGLVGA